jgi:RNA polymerase sigma-70 factor (sigma-E family)
VDLKSRLRGRSGTGRPHLVNAAVTPGWDGGDNDAMDREMDASQAVTAIYQEHALGLTRLAFLMLGDRQTAEDVVQEAFCGLYRAWDRMSDHAHALGYVRSSVLNGSRSALRRSRRVPRAVAVEAAAAASAEDAVLAGERQRETVAALRRLPPRQREAVVLRYFADLPEQETAVAMGVSRGTVKSTTSRALAALARMLQEEKP